MARDSSLCLRKAVVTALKADAAVSAVVGGRCYGPNPPAKPTWPFVRYGVPTMTPRRATCLDGATGALTIHCFAKGKDETEVSNLAAAVANALDGRVVSLTTAPYPAKAHFRWTSTIPLKDTDEADGWHAVVQVQAEVAS